MFSPREKLQPLVQAKLIPKFSRDAFVECKGRIGFTVDEGRHIVISCDPKERVISLQHPSLGVLTGKLAWYDSSWKLGVYRLAQPMKSSFIVFPGPDKNLSGNYYAIYRASSGEFAYLDVSVKSAYSWETPVFSVSDPSVPHGSVVVDRNGLVFAVVTRQFDETNTERAFSPHLLRSLVSTAKQNSDTKRVLGREGHVIGGGEGASSRIGRLGRAFSNAAIHEAADENSKKHYTVSAKDFLVLQDKDMGDWFSVLLNNGLTGYALKSSILDLEVPVHLKRELASNGFVGDYGAQIATYAHQLSGIPYKKSGVTESGIGNAEFVVYVFSKFGLKLEKSVKSQMQVGMKITRLEHLRAGDRIYLKDSKAVGGHETGIYLGDGRFIFSSSTAKQVCIRPLSEKKWLAKLVGARR